MTLLPGREISVIDYFRMHHKRNLKYPELPCVICGTSAKPVYFPLEVCLVPAQRWQLLQDSTASAEMIRVTAAGPDNRKRDIQSQMQNYVCKDRTPRDYGLDIKSQMVQVRARVRENFHNLLVAIAGRVPEWRESGVGNRLDRAG